MFRGAIGERESMVYFLTFKDLRINSATYRKFLMVYFNNLDKILLLKSN
jgi:hypothetical protein